MFLKTVFIDGVLNPGLVNAKWYRRSLPPRISFFETAAVYIERNIPICDPCHNPLCLATKIKKEVAAKVIRSLSKCGYTPSAKLWWVRIRSFDGVIACSPSSLETQRTATLYVQPCAQLGRQRGAQA